MTFPVFFRRLLVSVPGLLVLIVSVVSGQDKSIIPPVRFEEYRLSNGLRVILHVDKTTPVVAVNVWYHVGSKDEKPGKTGFAHLFEHLMFQGSKNYNANFHEALLEFGAGSRNGITTRDTTNYFEVVPSNFLEPTLFLEADRMSNLLPVLTQKKLDTQRDVVKNERRQFIDNQPYETWREKAYAELYPKDHPYHWHTSGSIEDLSKATLEDAKAFFRQYYVPNNAILSVAGDFDVKQTKHWIQKYFGPIPKGPNIARPRPPQPKLKGEIRRTVEDSVPQPRLFMVWHGVSRYAADHAALEMLTRILSRGRSSRFANFTVGKRIGQNVNAWQDNNEGGGEFIIQASPVPGKTLAEVEKEIDFELDRIKKEPPTAAEISRALNQIEFEKLSDLQTPLIKGDLLADFALYLNKTGYFEADFHRFQKVTPADVQRVANTYLRTNRLVLSYVPGASQAATAEKATSASTPATPKEKKKEPGRNYSANLPKPGPNPQFSLPPIEQHKLSNGLEVWTVRQGSLPIVSLSMVFNSGVISEPEGQYGVFALTNGLLRSGTKTRSAVDISDQLQSLGATIGGWLDEDYNVSSLQTLSRNLDQALDLYSDVIVNPIFPETELESIRRVMLNGLAQPSANVNAMANRALSKVVYGSHPYGRHLWGTADSVKGITREDALNYHRSTYLPNRSVLIVVGNFDQKRLIQKLENVFSNWKPGTVKTATISEPEPPNKTTVFLIDKAGASQSSIRIGRLSGRRDTPDYASMQAMSMILGGGAASRIFKNIREDKGFAYSAGSIFIYHRTAGHFECFAEVQTAVTKEALVELLKELDGIRGEIPISQKELESRKQAIIRAFPSGFVAIQSTGYQVSELAGYGLPLSHFDEYLNALERVTPADVTRVANKSLPPDELVIVIVGDRKSIEPGIKDLGYPVIHLDSSGNRQNEEVKPNSEP